MAKGKSKKAAKAAKKKVARAIDRASLAAAVDEVDMEDDEVNPVPLLRLPPLGSQHASEAHPSVTALR